MIEYASEAAVADIINTALRQKGILVKAAHHEDVQPANSLTRIATYKIPVSATDGEATANAVYDIGLATDRGIVYIGSKTDVIESGEIRYILLQAKINPRA